MSKEKKIDPYSFKELYNVSSPIPVLNFNKKLAVYFSAKSGCTFTVKWFFYQIDHLNAALDFNHFVHKYRWQVYLRSDQFIKSQDNFINNKGKGYLKIKVVRNPFERAVSSYMHFLGMLEEKHPALNNNFNINYKKMSYSFAEFLNMLKDININNCDIHWRRQFQLVERQFQFDHIIHLKNSKKELLSIEETYNLKKTLDIEKLAHSGHHSKKKESDGEFCGYKSFTFEIRKNRPSYKFFYNHKLEESIRTIYNLDFEKYNFDLAYLSPH